MLEHSSKRPMKGKKKKAKKKMANNAQKGKGKKGPPKYVRKDWTHQYIDNHKLDDYNLRMKESLQSMQGKMTCYEKFEQ